MINNVHLLLETPCVNISRFMEALLRAYPWSSYRAYAGLAGPEDFVDYGPILALVGGNQTDLSGAYRGYMETGLSQGDEEFVKILHSSSLGVGSHDFHEELNKRYAALIGHRVRSEDDRTGCAFGKRAEPEKPGGQRWADGFFSGATPARVAGALSEAKIDSDQCWAPSAQLSWCPHPWGGRRGNSMASNRRVGLAPGRHFQPAH